MAQGHWPLPERESPSVTETSRETRTSRSVSYTHLMATYIGQTKKGILGAVVATIGVILPSFIIIILVIKVLAGIGDNKYVNGALAGIKAAATGLIAYSAYKVGKQVLKGPFQWILALLSFAAIAVFSVNAVWAIVAGIDVYKRQILYLYR